MTHPEDNDETSSLKSIDSHVDVSTSVANIELTRDFSPANCTPPTRSASTSEDTIKNTKKGKGRGKAFTEDEVLGLAKAWIQQSGKGCNQHNRTMWKGIEDICRTNFGMDRTANSLRSTWHRVARETQHFIAARMKVRAMRISGANDETLEEIVQEQYRKKAGKKGPDGRLIYAQPFQWISTADFLSDHDKFLEDNCNKVRAPDTAVKNTSSERNGEEGNSIDDRQTTVHDVKEDTEISKSKVEGGAQVISDEEMEVRPKGIKRKKAEEKEQSATERYNRSLRGIERSIQEGNEIIRESKRIKVARAENAQDIELLKLLDRDSQAFQEIMRDVLERRREKAKQRSELRAASEQDQEANTAGKQGVFCRRKRG